MEIYLVGGAIRDELLGLSVAERDYVVTGATVEQMQAEGFVQVGKDFPVFLHPKTHEEYALARVERKVAKGYKGFTLETNQVTLKDDLARRDLTINAMARDQNGNLIDFFNGKADLEQRIFRHITTAFAEDPVRILRVARFAARFMPYHFRLAERTRALMRNMVDNGEVDALVAERVWAELAKTLSYPTPSAFFTILKTCDAIDKVLPNLARNDTPDEFAFLDNVATDDTRIKFALMCHRMTLQDAIDLCQKLKAPKAYTDLAQFTARYYQWVQNFAEQSPDAVYQFYQATDALRRSPRFLRLLTVFELLNINTDLIKQIFNALKAINISHLAPNEIAKQLPLLKQQTIRQCLKKASV